MHDKPKLRRPTASRRLVVVSTTLLALAGCQESRDAGASQEEMAWARVALERNPSLELIATDTDEGVFTVRDRRTGQVHAVRLDDIAAAPIAVLTATGSETDADAPADKFAQEGPVEDVQDGTAQLTDAEPSVALDTAAEAQDYTIERAEGRVRVTGPGVSIVSAGSTEQASAKGEPGQRTVDPIVCDGPRTMHFDGRSIYVDGDAITVSGGCALYITNSRIVASATGVVVQEGVVHIDNSYVEGGTASFDVGSDARIYLRGSTFQGLMRRDAVAMIEDQGGNRGLPTL